MSRDSVSPTLDERPEDCGLSRRQFIKLGAIAGGSAAFLGSLPGFAKLASAQESTTEGSNAYQLVDPANQIYTVCLQCNTGCGIKVKLLDGVVAKIEGNPFSRKNTAGRTGNPGDYIAFFN